MLREWSDRLPPREAAELWQRSVNGEVQRRIARLEKELRRNIKEERLPAAGFYEAMRGFLILRDKLFPDLPADPAWRILVTLSETPENSPKTSITGIANGAGLSMTTALRCLAAMEVKGIIERVRHPCDNRQVMIRLTKEGRRRLDLIADKWLSRMVTLALTPVLILVLLYGASLS